MMPLNVVQETQRNAAADATMSDSPQPVFKLWVSKMLTLRVPWVAKTLKR